MIWRLVARKLGTNLGFDICACNFVDTAVKNEVFGKAAALTGFRAYAPHPLL